MDRCEAPGKSRPSGLFFCKGVTLYGTSTNGEKWRQLLGKTLRGGSDCTDREHWNAGCFAASDQRSASGLVGTIRQALLVH